MNAPASIPALRFSPPGWKSWEGFCAPLLLFQFVFNYFDCLSLVRWEKSIGELILWDYSTKGSSINYVIADRGGGVSPKDYSIT